MSRGNTVTAPATICGGLPIIAKVTWSYDEFSMEWDADVDAIYWRKRDGTAGKEVSEKVYEKAEKYDCMFCTLVDEVNDWCAMQQPEDFEGPPELFNEAPL